MESTITRADQLAQVRKTMGRKLPSAKLFTNDDANPATPMSVRAEWGNGRFKKVVRADSPSSTVEQFLSKAIAVLEPFQADNVPARHLTADKAE